MSGLPISLLPENEAEAETETDAAETRLQTLPIDFGCPVPYSSIINCRVPSIVACPCKNMAIL